MTALDFSGTHPLYIQHLESLGFRRFTDVCIWTWCDTGEWVDGCRIVTATPSGWYTWIVATNDRMPAEVGTVGGLRRYFSEAGVEPGW